jgi:membrane protein
MSEKKANVTLGLIKSFISPTPEQIDPTTAKGFFQDLLYRIKTVDMGGMGAQLAFFFLLSFFPLIIFLVTLLPYLNLKQEQIFEFMEGIIPAEVYSMVEGILIEVLTNYNGGLLSIGILGTIWSASRGVNSLMKTLNRAYDVEGKAGFMNRLWSLLFTVALVAVILIALVFPVFGQQIGNLVFSYIGIEHSLETVWMFVRWVTPPLLIFLILWIMYWIVPNTDPRLKFITVTPGAIFATLGWLALTYGFSFYIHNFGNFGRTYGSIGGVIILMLWLYFTGMILILGGLLNASIAKRKIALLNKQTA